MTPEPCISLVGAGPGDPDLLTVKALRLIQSADVVVYDRLVSDAIIDLIPAGVTRLFVGKQPGCHALPQEQINQLLLKLARAGHRVVRLKGGDPFIFGRGGEEALLLAEHGVRFEIVPGITAAAACSAYAGIPLTHRGLAHGVQLVTGHCRRDEPLDLDWRALAAPDLTLCLYMAVAHLEQIARELIAAGRAARTPVAVIARGTTGSQRRLLTRLDTLAASVREAGIGAPAMVVIGEVVTLAERLDWFDPAAAADAASEHITSENSASDAIRPAAANSPGGERQLRESGHAPL